MSKLKIFAVRDQAVDAFNRPFFSPSRGLAVRSFTDEVNRSDPANPMYAHHEEFVLYELGQFDEETGIFETINPLIVCYASSVAIR